MQLYKYSFTAAFLYCHLTTHFCTDFVCLVELHCVCGRLQADGSFLIMFLTSINSIRIVYGEIMQGDNLQCEQVFSRITVLVKMCTQIISEKHRNSGLLMFIRNLNL